MKTKNMIRSAVFASIMCICSVISVPIGSVPISMAVLGVVLTACTLSIKSAVAAVAVYILLGAVGLPVFSGFRGGIMVLAGPTGGYIMSYIPMAVFIGCFVRSLPDNKLYAKAKLASVSFGGVVISYFIGTAWFAFVTKTAVAESVMICVVPFVVFDIVKCIVGAMIAYRLRKI